MTRLNVYAGPAGFFIVRGGPEGDGAVIDIRFGPGEVVYDFRGDPLRRDAADDAARAR